MSDHYAVSVVLKNNNKSSTAKVKIHSRSYKHFNCDNFLHDIVNSPVFQNLFYINDTTCAWNLWKDQFLRKSNLHCPIFIKTIRDYSKPWISKYIIKQIHRRNYLHRKALRTRCPADWLCYKHKRNDITSSVRQSKFTYFNEKINSSDNNRNIWKVLKEALPHKQHRGPEIKISSQEFNNFFSTIGEKLTSKHENVSIDQLPNTLIIPEIMFEFTQINVNTFLTQLLTLKNNSKLDFLDFDEKLLRLSALLIAQC